jgi:hypothetical protein
MGILGAIGGYLFGMRDGPPHSAAPTSDGSSSK